MFNWYRRSAECYVFLPDVHETKTGENSKETSSDQGDAGLEEGSYFNENQFRSSVWFTRAWSKFLVYNPPLKHYVDHDGMSETYMGYLLILYQPYKS